MTRKPRLAFVTIGHSPRPDVTPEMIDEILAGRPRDSIECVEFGALDGLEGADLDQVLAQGDEPVFATRARDGREMTVSVARVEERLDALLQRIDGEGFDLIVLLCTGTHIRPLKQTVVIEAQKVVDNAISTLTLAEGQLGIFLPFERQIDGFGTRHRFSATPRYAAGSPYDGVPLAERAAPLADCVVTVMHCMGYSSAMRDELRAVFPHSVLHARGIVAGFVRQFL